MAMTTRFTELVGCTIPIQQAGMGTLSPPPLVAAVSEAGGLGMLGLGRPGVTVPMLARLLDEVKALTDRPFGVNLVIAGETPPGREIVVLAARRAAVVEFFYNDPDADLVAMVHDGGALAAWQAGSLAEAEQAAAAGCDFVIVQGIEAGGHIRGATPLRELLAAVLPRVDVPVLAAGGIATAGDVTAMLGAGADGVRIGTRFLAAHEAGTHPDYLAALIAADGSDTIRTGAFHVGWEGAPHRLLAASLAAAEAFAGDVVGETATLEGESIPIEKFSPLGIDRSVTGDITAMSMWAGMGVGAVKRAESAAEIVAELVADLG